ncbi:MAG TPA: hypothetical protein VFJ64_03420 [Solirubrobacterales bacterium]|nr:hypothetical protein [Solirubrobacterales bacterium]
MKPIWTLVLMVLATSMALAFGASTASAGTIDLCDKALEEEECPGNYLSHVHETSVGKAILLAEPKIECNVLFLGEVVAGNGALLVQEGNFTYSSCGSGCTVTEEGSAVTAMRRVGLEEAALIGELSVSVHVNCIGINCHYDGLLGQGVAKGASISTPANGEVVISAQPAHAVKGTFCPKEAKLDLTTTPLVPTYISR